jgi:G3E family GTPase
VEVFKFEEIVVSGDVLLIGKEDTVDASEDEIVEDMLSRLVRSVEFIVIFLRLRTTSLLLH